MHTVLNAQWHTKIGLPFLYNLYITGLHDTTNLWVVSTNLFLQCDYLHAFKNFIIKKILSLT